MRSSGTFGVILKDNDDVFIMDDSLSAIMASRTTAEARIFDIISNVVTLQWTQILGILDGGFVKLGHNRIQA